MLSREINNLSLTGWFHWVRQDVGEDVCDFAPFLATLYGRNCQTKIQEKLLNVFY